MRRALFAWLLAVVVAAHTGCAPAIPEGTYVCANDMQCPPGMQCAGGLCYRSPRGDAGPCEAESCEDLRANCGSLVDACGNTVECGMCSGTQQCGAGGLPNICGCGPRSCGPDECGAVDDGCGGTIECGGCSGGAGCVGGTCTCVPRTCEDANAECGTIADGCGGTVQCDECPPGEFCGAGNQCGTEVCVPDPDPCGEQECDYAPDGCGDVVSCGECESPATCGGGTNGQDGQCGCTPEMCSHYGATCGTVVERCGTTLECGTCGPGYRCNDARTCECEADAAEPNNTLFGAAARGKLAQGDSAMETALNVHTVSDHDWLRWETSPEAGQRGSHQFTVTLEGIAEGNDFDLEVFPQCDDVGIEVVPTCMTGTPILGGCASRMEGSATERVVASVSSCERPTVFVHVVPAQVNDCSPYTLTVAYDRGSVIIVPGG